MKVVDLVDTSSGTCGTRKSEFVCESYDQRKFGKISINRNSPEVNFISVTFQKSESYCSRNSPYDVINPADPTRPVTRPDCFPAIFRPNDAESGEGPNYKPTREAETYRTPVVRRRAARRRAANRRRQPRKTPYTAAPASDGHGAGGVGKREGRATSFGWWLRPNHGGARRRRRKRGCRKFCRIPATFRWILG